MTSLDQDQCPLQQELPGNDAVEQIKLPEHIVTGVMQVFSLVIVDPNTGPDPLGTVSLSISEWRKYNIDLVEKAIEDGETYIQITISTLNAGFNTPFKIASLTSLIQFMDQKAGMEVDFKLFSAIRLGVYLSAQTFLNAVSEKIFRKSDFCDAVINHCLFPDVARFLIPKGMRKPPHVIKHMARTNVNSAYALLNAGVWNANFWPFFWDRVADYANEEGEDTGYKYLRNWIDAVDRSWQEKAISRAQHKGWRGKLLHLARSALMRCKNPPRDTDTMADLLAEPNSRSTMPFLVTKMMQMTGECQSEVCENLLSRDPGIMARVLQESFKQVKYFKRKFDQMEKKLTPEKRRRLLREFSDSDSSD